MNNLLSLGLGFLSWGFGIGALWKPKKEGRRFASLTLCIVALGFQFREVNRLVNKGDWAAIEDTFPGVFYLGVTVLVSITLLLNTVSLLRAGKAGLTNRGK